MFNEFSLLNGFSYWKCHKQQQYWDNDEFGNDDELCVVLLSMLEHHLLLGPKRLVTTGKQFQHCCVSALPCLRAGAKKSMCCHSTDALPQSICCSVLIEIQGAGVAKSTLGCRRVIFILGFKVLYYRK